MFDYNTLAATDFWSTPIGKWTVAILGAVGIIVVLAAVLKSIPKFTAGKFGDGLKIIIGGLVIAAICIKPSLITDMINTVADLLGKGTDSVNQIGSGSGSAPQ